MSAHTFAKASQRPVKAQRIKTVLAGSIGLMLHLFRPFAAVHGAFRRSNLRGRVFYAVNRIAALEERLRSIDNTMRYETQRVGASEEVIRSLAAMKRAAVEEIADMQAELFDARQQLDGVRR